MKHGCFTKISRAPYSNIKKSSPQHLQFQSVKVVFYVPGNHELWVSKEADSNRVMAEEMVRVSGTRKINCVESLQISPEMFSFCRYLRNILRHTPKQMNMWAITM